MLRYFREFKNIYGFEIIQKHLETWEHSKTFKDLVEFESISILDRVRKCLETWEGSETSWENSKTFRDLR